MELYVPNTSHWMVSPSKFEVSLLCELL